MPRPATANARIGATMAGTMTLPTSPEPITAWAPSATKAAPTTPPIRACEELDGRPKYQVARFHAIAPISPANTIRGVIRSASTMPWATVAATSSEMNAPAKFRTAAKPTASLGAIARVEIEVATTFAVSWKPLVKSKASAAATTITRIRSPFTAPSGVLDHDAFENVRDALGGVDGLLQALVDVLPADDDHRVDPVVEERGHGFATDAVAVILQPVDLDGVVGDVLEAAHAGHRLGDLTAGRHKHLGQPHRLLHGSLDLVEDEEVGGLLGEVDDIVQRGGQAVDVLSIDRGHEGLIEALDDVVGDPVALLLGDEDLPGEPALLREVADHLQEEIRRPHDVPRGLLEEIEEFAFLGCDQRREPQAIHATKSSLMSV